MTNWFAYIDPGSGSMILQLILGGVAGVAIALKFFWKHLLTIFGLRKRRMKEKEEIRSIRETE